MAVLLETSLGDIVIDLYTKECPKTCLNFLKLCKIKYYNDCIFHNVQKDFLVQTGDPTGTGKGGDSIFGKLYGAHVRYFNDEISPKLKHNKRGCVSMANIGPNTNASQFVITTSANVDYLDGKHTIFGEVAEGLDVLEKINRAYCDDKNRPYQNIRIRHTSILDDPFPDPNTLSELIPPQSPEPIRDRNEVDRLEIDDDNNNDILDEDKRTEEEIDNALKAQAAKSRAEVLEMLGDLPDAELKPPDNVLFVCKLNQVTRDEDLNLIFSRFGKIINCEIIRDYKTGDSLQYAFIEFERKEDCEQAYFKMDNVLIDDRRIHVDFSQSVSKLWNAWHQKNVDAPSFDKKGQLKLSNSNLRLKKSAIQGVGHGMFSGANQMRQRDSKHYEHVYSSASNKQSHHRRRRRRSRSRSNSSERRHRHRKKKKHKHKKRS